MTSTTMKTQATARIERELTDWDLLLAEIGESRMEQAGVAGEWSDKDIVAHEFGWQLNTLASLEAQLRGEPEPSSAWPGNLTTDDEINAWIVAQNVGRSLSDVLGEARAFFARLSAVVAASSEADLADPGHFPALDGAAIVDGGLFSHLHEDHEPEIRAWLAQG